MAGPSGSTHSSVTHKVITPSNDELDPRPVGLYIMTDGTITMGNDDGTDSGAVPVFAGQQLPWQPFKITAAGGGATVLGLYH